MYKDKWTQPWPMGSKIYPEVHENPRALAALAQSSGNLLSNALGGQDCITNHGFDDAIQLHIFYHGLRLLTNMILDASTRDSMMSQSPKEGIVTIDSIATSGYQSHHGRAPVQRKGIMDLDTQNAILAQNKLLTQQIEALTKQQSFESLLCFTERFIRLLGKSSNDGFCTNESRWREEPCNEFFSSPLPKC